jgi:hypothetical protein
MAESAPFVPTVIPEESSGPTSAERAETRVERLPRSPGGGHGSADEAIDRAVADWDKYLPESLLATADRLRKRLEPARGQLAAALPGDPRVSWLMDALSLPGVAAVVLPTRSVAETTRFGRLHAELCLVHRDDRAEQAFAEAHELEPRCPRVMAGRALAASFRGGFREARSLAKAALTIDPASPLAVVAYYRAHEDLFAPSRSLADRRRTAVDLCNWLQRHVTGPRCEPVIRFVLGRAWLDVAELDAELGRQPDAARHALSACSGLAESDPCFEDANVVVARARALLGKVRQK